MSALRFDKEAADYLHASYWPEGLCQNCLGKNVVWAAANDLWNAVMGDESGIVCPTCFVLLANKSGIGATFFVDCPAAKLEGGP